MTELLDSVMEWVQGINPAFLLPALSILPTFAFPASVLLFLIGGYYGPVYGMFIAVLGIAINDAITYWLARTFLRGPIMRLLERKNVKVPVVPADEEIRVIAILRIAPGSPLFLQSYALGLANVDFRKYMLVSIPIQALHAAGIIVFGDAIFEGKTGAIIFGVSLMVVMVILFRIIHSQYQARAAKKSAS
ncbi:MAG: TVP38/TMEM64 family protein [Puniceicoccales bacterium]